MTVPRADGTIPARLKALEDEIRRIKLQASVTQAGAAPLDVATNSVWFDQADKNRPNYFDGTAWVPVRDETIAIAQADITTAQGDITTAQGQITTLTGTTIPALQTDVSTAQGQIDTLNTSTLPTLQGQVNGILPITETDITDGAISTPKIQANAVTAAQILAGAVTTAKLDAGAVTAAKITAGTITGDRISGSTITAAQIASRTITAGEIATGTITALQISATAIDGKTITGALIRTAATGQRWEITSAPANKILAYGGQAGEVAGGLEVAGVAGDASTYLRSPSEPTHAAIPQAEIELHVDGGAAASEAIIRTTGGGSLIDPTSAAYTLSWGQGIFYAADGHNWLTPTLLNSWVNFGGVWPAVQYYKYPDGDVGVRGVVKSGTAGTIFTLPVGYRPPASIDFVQKSNSDAATISWVQVAASGAVAVAGGLAPAQVWLSLSLRFSTLT
jgi:hypothetical protein